ncbi:MAG: magnesium transporter [Candidatus Aenigmarchaeota archaeon]|nr:magnesium transporter [Candidatus Aenigmarchaeota archaeon]
MRANIYKELSDIFHSQMLALTLEMFAGIFIAISLDKILLIPGLLILIPGFMEMRGNISGTLSARLSSGLILGRVKPKWHRSKILRGNLIASFALVIADSIILGLAAWLVTLVVFGFSSMSVIWIALGAGIISNIIQVPLVVHMTFWLFKRGHDPNDIMGPYVTAMGDVFSTLSLFLMVILI